MSKAKAILQRIVDGDNRGDFFISNALLKEIEAALSEPEHIADVGNMVVQEPVAWCQMVEGKVQDLLTSFEMKDWLYDKSWIPLYTAPPKREPLSVGGIDKLIIKAFYDGLFDFRIFARAIEKAHGIGVDDE